MNISAFLFYLKKSKEYLILGLFASLRKKSSKNCAAPSTTATNASADAQEAPHKPTDVPGAAEQQPTNKVFVYDARELDDDDVFI